MGYRRGEGLFGLVGALTDEFKWFADQRAPYPIERNLRAALSVPGGDRPAAATLLDAASGIGYAVLDDSVDSGEPRRRRARRPRPGEESRRAREAALADLRTEIAGLAQRVDRLGRGGPEPVGP